MTGVCLSILEATTEPPYERPNEGITQCIARDIDRWPNIAGDKDGVDRAVTIPAKGSRCQIRLVRLVEADPAALPFHRVTIDDGT